MFPPQGASNQSTPLDGPPPSPQSMGAGPTGAPTQFSLSAVAPGSVPTTQLPPEVLTAIVSASQKIATLLDGFTQATPDMGPDWDAVKQALQMALAKLMTQGAGAMSPTATGQQFPGGGMDRGISGAGTI